MLLGDLLGLIYGDFVVLLEFLDNGNGNMRYYL